MLNVVDALHYNEHTVTTSLEGLSQFQMMVTALILCLSASVLHGPFVIFAFLS